MTFKTGNTTFGFTMRVPATDEAEIDDLIASHAKWMSETHSLTPADGAAKFAAAAATHGIVVGNEGSA